MLAHAGHADAEDLGATMGQRALGDLEESRAHALAAGVGLDVELEHFAHVVARQQRGQLLDLLEASPEALVGGFIVLLVILYVVLYLRSSVVASRYRNGFVVDVCPICHRGHLQVEERKDSILGIPLTRWTVRCTNCRSILREVGRRRWRYTVDRTANRALYDRFNGRHITDEELRRLGLTSSRNPIDE